MQCWLSCNRFAVFLLILVPCNICHSCLSRIHIRSAPQQHHHLCLSLFCLDSALCQDAWVTLLHVFCMECLASNMCRLGLWELNLSNFAVAKFVW